MRILVTGATGTVGRQVVAGLVAAGVDVRAVTRRPDEAGLPETVEVIGGDLDEPEALAPAFEGVDAAFLLAAGRTRQVAEVAERAGVQRIVVLSAATAGSTGLPGGEHHRAAELAVEESGLKWTHVRPGMFTANFLGWAGEIRADGVVRAPHAQARHAPVHEDDIAAVAVAALLSDEHTGRVLTLTGPEVLTKPEQVAALSRGIGREVEFHELTPQQWCEHAGVPASVADFLLGLWEHAEQHPDAALPTIPEVLGRPAKTVTEWAREHASEFR